MKQKPKIKPTVMWGIFLKYSGHAKLHLIGASVKKVEAEMFSDGGYTARVLVTAPPKREKIKHREFQTCAMRDAETNPPKRRKRHAK